VKDSPSLSKNPGGDFNRPGKGLEIGLSESTEAQPANHTHKINNGDRCKKRSHCAGRVLTPPLLKYRKGDARPLWNPQLNGFTLQAAWSTKNSFIA